MGFWTVGPVAGSLIVAVVGSATVPAVVTNDRIWTDQYLYLRHRRPRRLR